MPRLRCAFPPRDARRKRRLTCVQYVECGRSIALADLDAVVDTRRARGGGVKAKGDELSNPSNKFQAMPRLAPSTRVAASPRTRNGVRPGVEPGGQAPMRPNRWSDTTGLRSERDDATRPDPTGLADAVQDALVSPWRPPHRMLLRLVGVFTQKAAAPPVPRLPPHELGGWTASRPVQRQ
jgi:hypothetical protein